MTHLRTAIICILFLVSSSTAYAETSEYAYSFENQLIDAADVGNEYEVAKLLKAGNPVNKKGLYDTTALMRASLRGQEIIVKYLLEAGADVHAKDIGGATALHLASRTGHRKVAEVLLKYGASPDVADNEGYSPLKRAILSQHVGIVDAMIKKGADLDTKGATGISARDLAQQSRNEKIRTVVQEDTKQIMDQQPLLGIPSEEVLVEPLAKKESIAPIIPDAQKIPHVLEKPKSSVSVDEAIKVPHDANLSDEGIEIKETSIPETADAQDIKKPIIQVTQSRSISMEVGPFDNEEAAITFWQNLTEKKLISNRPAKLVYDNTTSKTQYKLRFEGYTTAPDVFNGCKTVRAQKADVLCYVIHSIY
jgi:hypothetical protein